MYSSVVVALSYLIDPDTPKNDGTFRPLEIIAKPGTVVWANPGAPVTLATNHCGAGNHRGDHQGAGAGLPRARDGRLGPPLPHRDPGQGPARRHPMAIRRTPVHLAFLPGAARRRRVAGRRRLARRRRMAGRRRHQIRQPRSHRGALPAVLQTPRVPPRFRRRRASIAAVPAGSSRWSSRPPSRRSATPPATACATAPAASSAARTACRTATLLYSGNERAARDQDQGNRPCDPPRRRLVLESGGGGGWGDPAERDPAAIAERFRERVCDADDGPSPAKRCGLVPSPALRERGCASSLLPLSRMRERVEARRELRMYRIGIDVGGTFTDLVAVDDFGRRDDLAKVPSTPHDPSIGVLDGLTAAGRHARHRPRRAAGARPTASCTARPSRPMRCSNARAPGSALLTTEGHRDVIEMREGLKDDRYNLRMPPPEQLVPRRLRLGVRERMRADGRVEIPLDPASLDARDRRAATGTGRGGRGLLSARLARPAPRARDRARRSNARCPTPMSRCPRRCCRRSRSSSGSRRRSSTPMSARCCRAIWRGSKRGSPKPAIDGPTLIIQSHGGVAPIAEAGRLAAGAVLSGPAGGVAGSVHAARLLGERRSDPVRHGRHLDRHQPGRRTARRRWS